MKISHGFAPPVSFLYIHVVLTYVYIHEQLDTCAQVIRINFPTTRGECTIRVYLMLNADDESSLQGQGKGVQKATTGTRTLSGETSLAVTTCTIRVCLMLNADDCPSLKPKGRGKGQSGVQKAINGTSGETSLAVTTCNIRVGLILNADDESLLPKSKPTGRGKGQSGVQKATKGTRTLSGFLFT